MNITECCDKGYFLFSQKFILHFCLGKFHIGIIIAVNITVTYVHVDSAEFFCFFISTLCSHFLVDFICSNQGDHRVWRQEHSKLILDTLIDQIRYN